MIARLFCAAALICACASGALAGSKAVPDKYDDIIRAYARTHGLPERLVHRVVLRESRYNAAARNRSYWGLMQITYATARSMGYKGKPAGLLDPDVNLTYAVPYLANAYRIAGGDENRAVRLYASGYYASAKRAHLLSALRTAELCAGHAGTCRSRGTCGAAEPVRNDVRRFAERSLERDRGECR